MIETIIMILIGYFTLYAVIWLHEVGHSIGYAFYGCKKNWLHVTVRPYLFFSTPAPVDGEKAAGLTRMQNTVVSYGGVIANLFWTIISVICIYAADIPNVWVQTFLWLFFTLHLAEIVSYMFIGNIYPVSDMASIAALYPKLRFPNLLVGGLLTVGYVICLMRIPDFPRLFVILWNVITILCMCGGRIAFTLWRSKAA